MGCFQNKQMINASTASKIKNDGNINSILGNNLNFYCCNNKELGNREVSNVDVENRDISNLDVEKKDFKDFFPQDNSGEGKAKDSQSDNINKDLVRKKTHHPKIKDKPNTNLNNNSKLSSNNVSEISKEKNQDKEKSPHLNNSHNNNNSHFANSSTHKNNSSSNLQIEKNSSMNNPKINNNEHNDDCYNINLISSNNEKTNCANSNIKDENNNKDKENQNKNTNENDHNSDNKYDNNNNNNDNNNNIDNNDNNNNNEKLNNDVNNNDNNNGNNLEKKFDENRSEKNNDNVKNNNDNKSSSNKVESHLNKSNNKLSLSKSSTKQIIDQPKLILKFTNNSEDSVLDEIIITPNSIKNLKGFVSIYESGHKFYFGKDESNKCKLADDSSPNNQFFIFFNNEDSEFYVNDLSSSTGLYVKIKDCISIIENQDLMVGFGEELMYLQVCNAVNNSKDISISFLNKNSRKIITFNSIEYQHNKTITIGRDRKCTFKYTDDQISSIHCTFAFINKEWVLFDGRYDKNKEDRKKSSNGIWQYVKIFKLDNDMIFRNGKSKIKVNVSSD